MFKANNTFKKRNTSLIIQDEQSMKYITKLNTFKKYID